MTKSFLITSLQTISAILVSFFLYSYIKHHYATLGFEKYVVAKRTISLSLVLSQLGLAVGITREVSRNVVQGRASAASSLIKGSIILYTLIFVVCLPTVCFFSKTLSTLLYSSPEYGKLVISCFIYVYASLISSVMVSYYRGINNFLMFNEIGRAHV